MIIATRVGGLPDLVVEGVNGILVEPGMPDQLATALCQLIDDREKCATMGKESSWIARDKFDIEQHVTQLIDIYKKVSSKSSTKSSTIIPNI